MCALFVARPLFPSESAAQGDGLPVVMLWIALAVVWLLGVIGRRQFRVRLDWIDAAVALLIGLHTVAALWATAHGSPRPAVNMLWEWIALGLSFFLARQFITTGREARAVAAVMIALAVALAGYGLYQYSYELPQTRAQYHEDPDGALREAGMWFPPGSHEREMFEKRLYSTEPVATFALTNSLAGYLAPWLVVLVGIGIGGGLRRKQLSGWLTVAVCALPITACLLLTKSRSGYVATAFGLLLIWLLRREPSRSGLALTEQHPDQESPIVRASPDLLGWRLPAVLAGLVAVLIAAAVFTGGLDRRVLWEASKSLGYRVQYWQSTLRMIADHPLAGCGPGNFQDAYTRYKLPEASEDIADPHNFFLEVWATAGTPAALALLGVLALFAHAVLRPSQDHEHPPPSPRAASRGTDLGETDAWRFVLGGAAAGFLLAVPIGWMSAAPPGITAVLLGLPLAAACTAMLTPWIIWGRLPVFLPAIGVLVLLVNLLAAGGMGFPGVAGSLWLLMALGANLSGHARVSLFPRSTALAALTAAVALAVTCYASAYGPVLRSGGAMRRAWEEPSEAPEHLQEAAEADPLAAEPRLQLAAFAFHRWQQNPTPEIFKTFERRTAEALELAPRSASMRMVSGDRYLDAFLETRQEDYAEKAVRTYGRAVDLDPNNGLGRAKLAVALRASGDEPGFQEQAAAALRLDELTPHADRKLPEGIRLRLLENRAEHN